MGSYIAHIENFDDRESDEKIAIRNVLRLSENWIIRKVIAPKTRSTYSDDGSDPPEPVVVNGRAVDRATNGAVLIKIEPKPVLTRCCPCCGAAAERKGWVSRELKHTDLMGSACFLEVTLPKMKCRGCGSVSQIVFPMARPNVTYTKMFEEQVIRTLMEEDQKSTAERLGTTRAIVEDILRYRVRPELDKVDLSTMSVVFVDEIQFRRGHDYVTVFSTDEHRVAYIVEGKDSSTVWAFKRFFDEHGGVTDNVGTVSADMSPAFENTLIEAFPQASLVWDHFHVTKAINDDLNDVRRHQTIGEAGEILGGSVRYTVLYRSGNLPEHHQERMQNIRLHNPVLALAYDMKEAFFDIYKASSKEEASILFDEWIEWAKKDGAPAFQKRAFVYEGKKDLILAWFDDKISNGTAEGINSVLKKIRAQGCGYRNLENYKCMCFLRIGQITVSVRGGIPQGAQRMCIPIVRARSAIYARRSRAAARSAGRDEYQYDIIFDRV